VENSLFKIELISKIIKDYVTDINRLSSYDLSKIKIYRDKLFRRLVKYAYSIPLYKDKYQAAGIHPSDIRGIEDIEKLPIINREDIIRYFPKGIIAPNSEKNSVLVNTSGSTRNPVSYYSDQYTLMKTLIIYVRELKYYGIKWNKSRISMIANFYSHTGPTRYFDSGAMPTLKPFFSLNNFQLLNCDDDLEEMIKKIDSFKPEIIAGFPGPLRHMAILKRKGYGKNVNPKCILSSGGLLDEYDKKYIEDTFNARVYNLFGATQSGPISFECNDGDFHINSDFIYLEAVDKSDNVLDKGKSGRLVLTRIYGQGTPLIRYTGMEDIVTLQEGTCTCGISTELIKQINGRIKESIVLPSGKVIFADALKTLPGRVMYKLKTDKIHFIQVVQESLDKVEVLVVIKDDERDAEPPVDQFLAELKKSYEKLFHSEVEVDVKEAQKLRCEEKNENSTPGVLSKIDVYKYL